MTDVSIAKAQCVNLAFTKPLYFNVADLNRVVMNKINPKKLLKSKWTAVKPVNKEKHFIISEIEFDEEDVVVACCIESVMLKRTIPINWLDLTDDNIWMHGWK
jgi:tryptophan-rich hypothetical protein